tara:strand:+ start:278 stop:379 length:102 start_codon:yes stop_codon:yes gene_type:complete
VQEESEAAAITANKMDFIFFIFIYLLKKEDAYD